MENKKVGRPKGRKDSYKRSRKKGIAITIPEWMKEKVEILKCYDPDQENELKLASNIVKQKRKYQTQKEYPMTFEWKITPDLVLHNLTGHVIRLESGQYFPAISSCRAFETANLIGFSGDMPIFVREYDNPVLPPMQHGKGYIVSQTICMIYPTRPDLFVPLGTFKNPDDKVVCRGVTQNPFYLVLQSQ